MSGPAADYPDPRQLYDELRQAVPAPPLPPLRIPEPSRSDRVAPVGRIVTGARRALLRVLAPSLIELVGQLERERHQQRARISELEGRIARLEGMTPVDR